MPNPDPEHHDLGVKPSAGTMRIARSITVCSVFARYPRIIENEVRPLLEALEAILRYGVDRDRIEAARAALAAWRGDA